MRIDELSEGDAYHQLGNLSALLIDSVESGASVGFMAGLTPSEAEAFWTEMLEGIPTGRTHLFAALERQNLIGAVLLLPAARPNQPHRADVAKLLVLRSARRKGVASRLMNALEERALALGRTLLTLDTATESGAEPFYRGRGYQRAGIVPNYALMPDGSFCATSIYYKQVA